MNRNRTALFVLLAVSLAAAWFSQNAANHAPALSPPAASRAFLRSDWGMTPEQVTEANGKFLAPAPAGRRFYETENGQEDRYRTLEAAGQKFLGREGAVLYTFKDDQLVSYHLFIPDTDCEKLDEDVRRYLLRTFGPDGSEVEDGSALKLVWQSKERVANYWFFEEELALSKPCRAVIGVSDRRRG